MNFNQAGYRRRMSVSRRFLLVCSLLLPLVIWGAVGPGTVLHDFNADTSEGAFPLGAVVRDGAGDIYGTTQVGGAHDDGVVFKLTRAGAFSVLHPFDGSDGRFPEAALALGTDGAFYGTTSLGGASAAGSVFRVAPTGAFSSIHSFSGPDGMHPSGALIADGAGSFYGTTGFGGGPHDGGTIFKINESGSLTTLYQFIPGLNTSGTEPAVPTGTLVLAGDGSLYGTTLFGGAHGAGAVFRLTPAGSFTTLYSFSNGTGSQPPNPILSLGADGNLYGVTISGGDYNRGSVFRLTPDGTFANLYSFAGPDGGEPAAALIQADDGNFYGTARSGGVSGRNASVHPGGEGVIFAITPGGVLTFFALDFTGETVDVNLGELPMASLVQDPADHGFFGTASVSPAGRGTVFKVLPSSASLSATGSPAAENGGRAVVTLTLARASASDTTAKLAFAGTATNGSDYTVSAVSLVIPAGSRTGSIILTAVDDSRYEGNEVAVASITAIDNGYTGVGNSVPITITDDDPPPTVSLGQTGSPFPETGGSATLTATLSFASPLDTRVDLAFSGTATQGADYTLSGFAPWSTVEQYIVIPAGQISGVVSVRAVSDGIYETDETVIASITGTVNASVASPANATVIITDDDPPPTVSLRLNSDSFAENGGTATVTAQLSGESARATTVALAFSGSANNGADYRPSVSTITIPAGNFLGTVTLTGIDDAVFEGSETIITAIGTLTNAVAGTPSSVTATITDDDAPPSVRLSLDRTSFAESGGVATVTAQLSSSSQLDTTIDLAFSGDAANGTDYRPSASRITIPAGGQRGTLTLTGLDDVIFEGNETVLVAIGNLTNASVGSPSSVTSTITDDDPPPAVSLSVNPTSFAENGGIATLTVRLSGLSATDTVINLTLAGTAGNGSDYRPSATRVVVPAGAVQGAITLTGVDDSVFEGDETVIATIDNVANGSIGSPASVTATITDDDVQPSVTLGLDRASFAESGGVANVTVRLNRASATGTIIDLIFAGTATNGADYTASAAQITIAAGALQGSVAVTGINDTSVEGDETVIASIGNVTNGFAGSPSSVTATITDDDVAPPPPSPSGGAGGGGGPFGPSVLIVLAGLALQRWRKAPFA